MIPVGEKISIPEKELRFVATRSSGPGGQNVNKVSTRVTLLFDLEATDVLSEEQKMKIRERLATRVNKEGVLRVVCQCYRSQAKNRSLAINRFVKLLETALEKKNPRLRTKIPESDKRRRRDEKARRSRIKQLRSKLVSGDE